MSVQFQIYKNYFNPIDIYWDMGGYRFTAISRFHNEPVAIPRRIPIGVK
jgi:hypothetical protein